MAYASLQELIGRFAGRRVLVIGDAMLDRYVYGSAERISPEAPIPVLRIQREQAMPGGAGNVARNVAAMGGRVSLIAVAAEDAAGTTLRRLLADTGAIEPALVAEAGRPTTEKTRFVAGGQQMLRADHEELRSTSGSALPISWSSPTTPRECSAIRCCAASSTGRAPPACRQSPTPRVATS